VIVVPVEVPGRPYDVVVGDGARFHLASVLPPGVARVAVVTQAGIGVSVGPGCEHRVFTIGDGEEAKSLATVEDLCRQWARWGLTRADVVVAVGGGVVTDVAGFAAAVYHRGVAVVFVPTTLLGQIDAAIGGKTGVNLPEGKNLVGAFWQPSSVLCDTAVLATLPEREVRNGFGELAKYHFLGLDDDGGATTVGDPDLPAKVAACVAIKAAVVSADERESGQRALLNYGHTLAHALEIDGAFDLRHGEAVAIGLVFAARLARSMGRIDDDAVARHESLVAGYGLPTTLPAGADLDHLVELMGRDKKAVDGLTFVLDGPRGPEVVRGVDAGLVRGELGGMP
jgi:5-deoxy-5-amino-3-dehydroquinate synthase